ncbi:MAG TPA: dihydrodipicolinate synthase family protein, partial [Flavisolibacter sp.]|nr:dihydrodipicolinate synthase family protein [Flavisolibacter sp.]
MMTKKKLSGVVIPAVTPLTEERKLDGAAVERMFGNFRQHKVHPFILGTTGEAASLPLSLKTDFLRLAGKLKKEEDVLYAGISSNCVAESIDLAKQSFDSGADVVVTTLPSYYPLTDGAMLRYFEELADRISGPLMVYNIPATTNMSIPLEVI